MTKTAAASLSILSNSLLIALKVAVGIATGSVSVISEAIHSGMDLVASLIAFFSVRFSDKAPDESHPYGHGKMENISGVVEALLILAAAFWILWESAHKLVGGKVMSLPGWGIAVMLVSAAVNILVSRILYKTARRTGSLALEADALHLKADVYTSLGVAIGLAFLAFFKLPILDPLVAMAVALFITREAIMLLNKALQPLLDKAFEPDELKALAEILQKEHCDYHKLRTRKSGMDRFIDMHLMFPRDVSLRAAHQKTRKLKTRFREVFPSVDVTIHMEPREGKYGGKEKSLGKPKRPSP